MRILTADQIREADRYTIHELGIPGIVLMENAAIRVVTSLQGQFPDLLGKRVGIFAGRGNNGGDGFAVSRHLASLGARVTVYLLAKKERVSGEAKVNLDIALKIGIKVHEIVDPRELLSVAPEIRHLNIIIDAILGTGTNKAVQGFYSDVISLINGTNKFTLSVDIPSGLKADSGNIPGNHIHANITTALQTPKICHYQYPAAKSCGKIVVVDIGIPRLVIEKEEHNIHLVTKRRVQKLIRPRETNTHKGTYGHLLCVCGSTGKGGAAGLAAAAAYRSGAGLVTLLIPRSLANAFEMGIPEVMVAPLSETPEGTISDKAFDTIMELAEDKEAVLLGPGLTTNPSTSSLVKKLVTSLKTPLILDADALNIISDDLTLVKNRKYETALTPHPGEMARLCAVQTSEIQENRVACTKQLSADTGATVVLKGANTIISSPDGSIYINNTGNPGMATGGTGDILAGMLSGFKAQGYSLKSSAITGTYLHGLSGDLAAQTTGEHSLIAGDLLPRIATAINEVILDQ